MLELCSYYVAVATEILGNSTKAHKHFRDILYLLCALSTLHSFCGLQNFNYSYSKDRQIKEHNFISALAVGTVMVKAELPE